MISHEYSSSSKNRGAWRILSSVVFFGCVLFAPWWISFLVGFALLMYWGSFWEFILGAFIIDSTFGVSLPQFGHITLLGTIVALILFLARTFFASYLFPKNTDGVR